MSMMAFIGIVAGIIILAILIIIVDSRRMTPKRIIRRYKTHRAFVRAHQMKTPGAHKTHQEIEFEKNDYLYE